jgi:hypothetical protein
MTSHWVTTGSTNAEAVVNPLASACAVEGYVPDELHLLANPGVQSTIDRIVDLSETVVRAFDGDPEVHVTSLETETDFPAIVEHFRAVVEAAGDEDRVAVDVTPGRKFMSAIAFQAGMQFGADHVFYLLVDSGDLFGRVYADLPRTATTLYDFREVFGE